MHVYQNVPQIYFINIYNQAIRVLGTRAKQEAEFGVRRTGKFFLFLISKSKKRFYLKLVLNQLC
jgi:hypothetical protein